MNNLNNTEGYQEIISDIVKQTQSELIYFFILVLIGLVVFAIPFVIILKKSKKDTNQANLNETQMILNVIRENSSVISSLKESIASNNTSIVTMLNNINADTSATNTNVTKILTNQKNMWENINELNRCHHELEDYIKHSMEIKKKKSTKKVTTDDNTKSE